MSPKPDVLFRKHVIGGVEHRQDPLFESWTRINPDRAKRVKHTGGTRRGDDLQRLIDASQETCPFCPERRDTETPVFCNDIIPSARLTRNENCLFPNKSPFGENHGVGILTDAHYVPMEAYTEETIEDSILLTQGYFREVYRKDDSARFPVYVWNFLPPSAGSIVHPHVQVLLESRPAPIIETLTEKCATWLVDLLEERGPTPFNEIQALAVQEDFKYWVLIEARQLLGGKVIDTRGPKRLGNKWALADQPTDKQAEELADDPTSFVSQCVAWLVETLETGPLSYGHLKQRAAQAGFKENVLQNARKRCPQIIDTLGPRRKGNKWALKQ